jgi:hypothetical protein
MKFKVGDKVKTLKTVSVSQQSFPIDSEGEVTEVQAGAQHPWPYLVRLSKYMADVRCSEDEIEFLLPIGSQTIIDDAYFLHYQDNITKPRYCLHEWKTYTGLKEVFDFCIICDEKK